MISDLRKPPANKKYYNDFYRQMKMRECNVFTDVCLFTGEGGRYITCIMG